MAIKDQKIYTSDYSGKDVAGLPDSVVGQADWLKGRFDALTKELVVPRFNAVIDELSGEEGGDSIGIGWRHGTLGKAVVSQDVRELRVDGGNRLEMAVDEDYGITPPVGHTLVDAYGQQRRETPRLQFLNADVSVVGDTTVDIQTGLNAGTHTALVLTGEAGKDGKYDVQPQRIGADLLDVVKQIIGG